MSRESLMTLPYMTEDVADAILDWIDGDDDTNPLGAEIAYYQSLPNPYEPRNAPMRSIQELELVAGVYNAYVRGEDWNLNGRLDPNENDGDITFPPDNEDDRLDAGWSGLLTTLSVDDELAPSGEARLDLRTASAGDVQKRTGVDSTQAQAIADYVAASANARMRDFIQRNLRDLAAIAQQGGGAGPIVIQDGQQPRVPNLSNEQLAALIDECAIDPETPTGPMPGKLNLNTCTAEMLEYLPGISPATADAIILERSGRPQGFGSIIDLVEVPTLSRRQVAQIYDVLTVRSNAYVVTSRGRDAASGLQVELVATIDRSSLPVVISEISVR
jgi:DNA uptake protein ComE-like DNA-binding protein